MGNGLQIVYKAISKFLPFFSSMNVLQDNAKRFSVNSLNTFAIAQSYSINFSHKKNKHRGVTGIF